MKKIAIWLLFLLSIILYADENHNPKQQSQIKKWVESLSSSDLSVRESAAAALGDMGEYASPYIIKIIESFESCGYREPLYPHVLINILVKIGEPAIPYLLEEYSHIDSPYATDPQYRALILFERKHIIEVRTKVIVEALGKIGKRPKQVIPILIVELGSEHASIRAKAAKSLGNFGEDAALAIPDLMRAFHDQNNYVKPHRGVIPIDGPFASNGCYYAAMSLGKIGRSRKLSKKIISFFIKSLSDQTPFIRTFAAMGIAELGEKADSAIPALILNLSDDYDSVRFYSLRALQTMNKKVASTNIPKLIKFLGDKTYYRPLDEEHMIAFSSITASILLNIGEEAVPALRDALKHQDSLVREKAAYILQEIEKKDVDTDFIIWCKTQDPYFLFLLIIVFVILCEKLITRALQKNLQKFR